MKQDTNIKLFENRKVRSAWDAEQERWYISICLNLDFNRIHKTDKIFLYDYGERKAG